MALNGFLSRPDKATGAQARGVAARRTDDRCRLQMLESYEAARLGWFWATDGEGRIAYISEDAARQTGSAADLIGQPLEDLFDIDAEPADEESQRSLRFLLRTRSSISRQAVRLRGSGSAGTETLWWEISAKPYHTKDGAFDGYRGSAKDVTRDREERQEAARLARFDGLTGVLNRRSMADQLERTLAATRLAYQPCSLFMIDLDRFKTVNDTLGHPAGDALLVQVAARLQQVVGDMGEIGRLGGDEFQLILPQCDDRGLLGELAQRCIQIASQPYMLDGHRVMIGASVGIAIAPFDGEQADDLTAAADLALYAAKGAGRGQFRFYAAEMKNGANLKRDVENNLRDALATEQIAMHYQPIVDLRTNKVACFEALMRWEREDGAAVPPSVFIPVAEDTGIIKELGRLALEQACRDAAAWALDVRVAVNVSAIQFAQDELPLIVARALEGSGLSPGRLELEITESVFMGDVGLAEDMLRRLKQLGVRLALDDFGTGYSSLSYLTNAPYDKIKIDQSFVRGATEPGNNNKAILKAIVDLAGSLSMDTVAEGVEAQDELELIRSLGASHGQGYIFSRALPQAEVVERLLAGPIEFEPVGPAHFRAERMTMIRRVGVIHEDHRYQAVLRNLSRTGARIEGLLGVQTGTELVVDLGDGQLAVATVRRSVAADAEIGVEFETPLVSDGAGGLCTRHRVSPYAMQAATNVTGLVREHGMAPTGYGPPRPRGSLQEVDVRFGKPV